MHLSTHNWMRAEPLETTLARIKKYGYESIEISGEPTISKPRTTRKAPQAIRHSLLGFGDVDTARTQSRCEGPRPARSTVDYMKSVITMVSELEGEIITLVPGDRRQDRARWHARGGMEMARSRASRNATSTARRRACASRIEPLNRFETYLLNRADQAMALGRSDRPRLRRLPRCIPPQYRRSGHVCVDPQGRQAPLRFPRGGQQPHGCRAKARWTGRRSSRR